ncbi:GNAT family N-acetyltransferase [Pseudoruegeria sp. HB172150]|uniref:GNAT family N-acetyltransferase n=1 Tax=Pseudoruegeria sp. HB172150 TaxID=2721164 RepID=UPI00155328B1|nr:GNAT family N-acetyltransferase [Pseudoruegeria sp. HB172150]
MQTRPATEADAHGMSQVLQDIASAGLRRKPTDPDFALSHYILDPGRIECTVAVDDDGTILGFQSLKLATEGNAYGVTPGWGIIGTHVSPRAARRGAGTALFAATKIAAKAAGIENIDATIGATNEMGLAYYEAMGFRTYGTEEGTIRKQFNVG